MPDFSPLSDPVVFVPGSATARGDGRYQLEFERLGVISLARALAERPYVCSALGLPRPIGTSILKLFAPHQALLGLGLCEEGWDLLTISDEPVVLMLWPQNRPDYREPGKPRPAGRAHAVAWR